MTESEQTHKQWVDNTIRKDYKPKQNGVAIVAALVLCVVFGGVLGGFIVVMIATVVPGL